MIEEQLRELIATDSENVYAVIKAQVFGKPVYIRLTEVGFNQEVAIGNLLRQQSMQIGAFAVIETRFHHIERLSGSIAGLFELSEGAWATLQKIGAGEPYRNNKLILKALLARDLIVRDPSSGKYILTPMGVTVNASRT